MSASTPILIVSFAICACAVALIASAAMRPARAVILMFSLPLTLSSCPDFHPASACKFAPASALHSPEADGRVKPGHDAGWTVADYCRDTSDAEIVVQFVDIGGQFGVADHVDDLAVLD